VSGLQWNWAANRWRYRGSREVQAMAANHHTIDLSRLSLSPGEGARIELDVDPGTLEIGGGEYEFEGVAGRLDVSRTLSGYALRLRFAGELDGPCMRCLEPARVAVEVDVREVDQPSSSDEELRSPYVDEAELRLDHWAHDSLALALPSKLLCRPDCAGLCPVCGEPLNDAAPGAHDHPAEPDPRWAKLRELQ
jgi:uncharacterized protein